MRSAKARVKAIATQLLNRRGYSIIPSNLAYPWQLAPNLAPSHASVDLTEEQLRYLSPDNPLLLELQKLGYAKFDASVTTPSVWASGYLTSEDLKYFRGDNAFRWQLRGRNYSPVSYVVTVYYLKSIDRLGLLDRLGDDNTFGNFTFQIDGKTVSSDLLDAVLELNFLDRHLQISTKPNLKMLDIGAGYGRLAHRTVMALPDLASYYCTDAIAASSFLSDFYIQYRQISHKAKTVFLDEVQNYSDLDNVDIAVNIHSFSECRVEAINWWVGQLARRSVRYLLIIPNAIAIRN